MDGSRYVVHGPFFVRSLMMDWEVKVKTVEGEHIYGFCIGRDGRQFSEIGDRVNNLKLLGVPEKEAEALARVVTDMLQEAWERGLHAARRG